jgi:two-component system copper resistance phosphate regulon response regulator CusR
VTTILIAEEEARITSFLEKGLQASGFSTEVVTSGEDALRLARSGDYALLVLDLGLPGKDGLAVLRELRSEGSLLPVVILTGRQSVRDKVAGLESGASDYVTKPFRFDELLARIRVRLSDEPSVESVLEAGDLALDLHTRHVIAGERTVPLSSREFELAKIFFSRPGQVLTRAELLSEVWGGDFDPGSNIIDVYVGYLRRKLGRERIASVRGLGYRLEPRPRRRQADAD